MKQSSADGLMLLTTALWGGTFVIIKSLLDDLPPSVFVLYRFAIALVLAMIIWRKSLQVIDRRVLFRGTILGLLFGVGFVLQTIGLLYTSVSSSAFITGTMVVFAPFVYWIVERSPIRPLHLISVVVVMFGLYVFTEPEVNGFNVGDILTLGGAIIWAVYLTYVDVWTKSSDVSKKEINALVVLQFAATVLLSLISIPLFGDSVFGYELSSKVILGLIYCSVFAAVITTWLQTNYQRFTHPVRAAVIFSVEPLVASMVAYFALDELWSNRQILGAVILLGVVLIPEIITMRRNSGLKK